MAGIFGAVSVNAGQDVNVWTAAADGKIDLVKQAIETLHGNDANVADENGCVLILGDVVTIVLGRSAQPNAD
jgi:hypothetical protein